MQFYEKLNYIMKLTQTSNSELARAIKVDPAVISRLRTGKRGLPRNQEPIHAMAAFFSTHCTTDFQHKALAEETGIKIMLNAQREQLSELLYYWLSDDTNGVNRFMRNFESLTIEDLSSDFKPMSKSRIYNNENFVYYGNEGKRAATRAVYQHILSHEEPTNIYIIADETDDWLMEDYEFTENMMAALLACIQKGFQICQIIPPIYSGDQILESLTRWIPLYMTGKVRAYYYPHIRDRLHRHTIIAVSGKIALASHSMAGQQTSYGTMLTTESRLLDAVVEEFKDYLSNCLPMLQTYTEPQKLFQCFMKFLSPHGYRIQKLHTLSAVTAPIDLINESIKKRTDPEIIQLGHLYIEEMKKLEQDDEQYDLIDIVHLASPEQVRNGQVPIASTYGRMGVLFYTTQTYIQHLERILDLLDTHENYHFVPLDDPMDTQSAFMVKRHRALLVHTSDPFTVFEISQPEIVTLYREHLLQLANKIGYKGKYRYKIKSRLRNLIRELQD